MGEPDRIAIITGTSAGIGAALAKGLINTGWQVIGFARRTAELDDPHYQHFQVDLGDLTSLSMVLNEHIRPILQGTQWQRVGLVNNAALGGALQPLEKVDKDQLALVFAVNAIAPIYLMGWVARLTPDQTWLRIVNLSTGAAVRAFPGLSDYGGSKAALRMAGMVFAAELSSEERPGGPRPRASILSYEPGVVDTDMQVRTRSTPADQFPWKQPFMDFAARGMLQPPAVVIDEVIEFLMSDSPEPFVERRFGQAR